MLWRDGVPTELNDSSHGNAIPFGLFVDGADVYVAGQYELLEAGVWKDGKAIRLPAWEGYSSAAYGIFVK